MNGSDELIRKDKIVQKLFFTAALIMLIGLPIFFADLQIALFSAVLGILIIAIFAGLTGNRSRLLMFADIIISIIGGIAFEFTAVGTYSIQGLSNYFFFNQIVAVIFFICVYYSVRALKNMFWKQEIL